MVLALWNKLPVSSGVYDVSNWIFKFRSPLPGAVALPQEQNRVTSPHSEFIVILRLAKNKKSHLFWANASVNPKKIQRDLIERYWPENSGFR